MPIYVTEIEMSSFWQNLCYWLHWMLSFWKWVAQPVLKFCQYVDIFISVTQDPQLFIPVLTHWGQMTHICTGKPTIIGSDNGLLPDPCQAIIWTSAGILLIGPSGTYFSEILTGIQTFLFKKMHLKMSSAKWRPFCLSFNVLTTNFILFSASFDITDFE